MKPYRLRSEIAIFKDGKVLIVVINPDKRGYPGGGLEEGETAEAGGVREALEEVGVKAIDVLSTGINTRVVGYNAAPENAYRNDIFAGSITFWVTGKYSHNDKTHLGLDKDAMSYAWLDITTAISMFRSYNNLMDDTRAAVLERTLLESEKTGLLKSFDWSNAHV